MIAIMAAMEAELHECLQTLELRESRRWNHTQIHRGTLEGREVIIAQSGVGKVLSAVTAQKILSDYPCEALLFIGVAGTVNPEYGIGDLLIGKDCAQWDMDAGTFRLPRGLIPFTEYRFLSSSERLLSAARDYRCGGEYRIHTGRLLSGDTFVSAGEKKEFSFLREDLEGDGVDMESAAVALVCTLASVPFICYKVISDRADGKTPRRFKHFLRVSSRKLCAMTRHIIGSLPPDQG